MQLSPVLVKLSCFQGAETVFAAQLVGQRWAQLSAQQKAAWSAKAALMRRSERGGGGTALSSADDGAGPQSGLSATCAQPLISAPSHHIAKPHARSASKMVLLRHSRRALHVLQLQASLSHI